MDPIYCYPGTNILKNNFGIKDFNKLHDVERMFTSFRIYLLQTNPIKGNFDLEHHKKIHEFIFKDVYDWAGKIRVLNISKGNTFFADTSCLESYSAQLHNYITKHNYFKNFSINNFCEKFSYIASEINMLHPFREGNGRSTREYLRCLAKNAGYEIDYSKIDGDLLYKAFVHSVSDISYLKDLFKDHFINNVRRSYNEEYIKKAPNSLIDKLNDVRLKFSPTGECLPVKDIYELYKKQGMQLENNLYDNAADFKLLLDTINEIKLENAKQPNINKVNSLEQSYIFER